MGSGVLNCLRITVACVFLCTALLVVKGSLWPFWATPTQIGLLALSGFIGFVFGDNYWFKSLIILGPGRATLLSALAPLFTVLIAWPMVGEVPGGMALLGMGLTIGGIFVVLGKTGNLAPSHVEGSVWMGIVAGILGAIGQAGGYVLSKIALQSDLDALSATVIRVTAAAVAIWLIASARGKVRRTFEALKDGRASLFMVGGAFLGPFLGVTLSLAALKFIEAGVAASITAVYPILALLLAARFHGERITVRAVLGTAVAVAGVVVLFLR